jgi:two-component system, sensor histidine kinase
LPQIVDVSEFVALPMQFPLAPNRADDSAIAPNREREIMYEQIRYGYREYIPGTIPVVFGGLLIVVVMWQHISHAVLLSWIGVLYLATAIRTFWSLKFNHAPPPIEAIDRWRVGFLLGSAGAGAVWGSVGVLMFTPDSLSLQMFLLGCIFAICAGAISVIGYYLPAFYAFAIFLVLPTIVRHALVDEATHWLIAVVSSIFLISFLGFGRRQNHFIVETLKIRHEKTDLIEQLKAQTIAAESATAAAKRATQEAERAKEEAQIANRAKSQFLATASHDLRQPLQAIALFSEALRGRIYYPEVRSIVDNINASVEALQSLFNSLLDISRLEAGVIEAQPIHFHAEQLLDKLRTDYTAPASEKNITLRIRRSDSVLFSDPMLVERVARNFVANAVRYTAEGGTVLVACRVQNDGRVRLEVRDNGIGISTDEQEKIFREFYQVGNPERDRAKGFGLGLAIVRGIENIIECKIGLRSAPDQGSIFSIAVPSGYSAPASATTPKNSKQQIKGLRGRSVIVLDDDQTVREAMQLLLSDWGCNVIAAATLDDAIAQLQQSPRKLDMIIADYRLRGGANGIDAIARIRSITSQTLPAVLITGDTGIDRLREVRESKLTLLHKPVVIAQLGETLSRALAPEANTVA